MEDIEKKFLAERNTIRIKKNFGLKLSRIIKGILYRILRLKLRVYSHLYIKICHLNIYHAIKAYECFLYFNLMGS